MLPVPLLVLSTLASALAATGEVVESLHLPLGRRQAANPDAESWAIAANTLRQTYGFDSLQRRQSTSSVPLTNQVSRSFKAFSEGLQIYGCQARDSSYLATIAVGTPCVMLFVR